MINVVRSLLLEFFSDWTRQVFSRWLFYKKLDSDGMFKKSDLNGVFKKLDRHGVFKKLDRDGVFKNLKAMAC